MFNETNLTLLAITVPIIGYLFYRDFKADNQFTPGACFGEFVRFVWTLFKLMLLAVSLLTLAAFALAWLVAVFDGSSGAALNAATVSLLTSLGFAYGALCLHQQRYVFFQDSPNEKMRKEIAAIARMPSKQIQAELEKLKQRDIV